MTPAPPCNSSKWLILITSFIWYYSCNEISQRTKQWTSFCKQERKHKAVLTNWCQIFWKLSVSLQEQRFCQLCCSLWTGPAFITSLQSIPPRTQSPMGGMKRCDLSRQRRGLPAWWWWWCSILGGASWSMYQLSIIYSKESNWQVHYGNIISNYISVCIAAIIDKLYPVEQVDVRLESLRAEISSQLKLEINFWHWSNVVGLQTWVQMLLLGFHLRKRKKETTKTKGDYTRAGLRLYEALNTLYSPPPLSVILQSV